MAERAGEDAISMADVNGHDIIVLYVIDTSYLNSLPQKDLRDHLKEELRKEGMMLLKSLKLNWKKANVRGTVKILTL